MTTIEDAIFPKIEIPFDRVPDNDGRENLSSAPVAYQPAETDIANQITRSIRVNNAVNMMVSGHPVAGVLWAIFGM
jgi:hypothetical protein